MDSEKAQGNNQRVNESDLSRAIERSSRIWEQWPEWKKNALGSIRVAQAPTSPSAPPQKEQSNPIG